MTPQTAKGGVLVVDDDEDFRSALALTLEMQGYTVQSAADGREALDLLARHKFDLVLSDIRMPKCDGIELLKESRQSAYGTPVVLLLTGFADISTEEAQKLGANALFSKPPDLEKLARAVAQLTVPTSPGVARNPTAFAKHLGKLKAELQFHGAKQTVKVMTFEQKGLYVALPQHLTPNVNEVVRLNLRVEDHSVQAAATDAIVRWAQIQDSPNLPAGCGVDFMRAEDAHLKGIFNYLQSAS